ncbi:MAG: chorismate synthase [Ruminococcaceae bacterium]|nr:chorismate synthase [Oscillospiraceae bacterium]
MASIIGNRLKVSIFGQSHAPGIGCVIDGLPAGEYIDPDVLGAFLARRAPGRDAFSTARKEADLPEFVSGLYEGKTCGAPLCAMIRNSDQHSKDYSEIADKPRPGHADYTAHIKYGGTQDVRGGGHFSGRLTAPLCIAGGIARQILARRGIHIGAHIYAINGVGDQPFDPCFVSPAQFDALETKPFCVIDDAAGDTMQARILDAKAQTDSVGGIIECAITGLPVGIGDPMFDGMENRLAHILFGVPAVKGVEFGDGFAAAALRGSENNDPMTIDEHGQVRMTSNHAGGILGGITTGMPLLFRCAIKPTPSIGQAQNTISFSREENATLTVHGRHDPCIVPRAVPVIIAAAAIGILDAMLDCDAAL